MHPSRRTPCIPLRIAFFSFSAALILTVALLSRYLPPTPEGTQDVTVPDLIGTQYPPADDTIDPALFSLTLEYRTDEGAPAGTVLSQSPAPHTIRRVVAGLYPCPIRLIVSAGAPTLTLPDLRGLDADAAELRLREMGLSIRRQTHLTTAYSPGQVIETRPAPFSVLHRGDTVTLIESTVRTRHTRIVPELRGMTLEQATATLRRLGLSVGHLTVLPSAQAADTVLSHSPPCNTIVTDTRAVDLTLSDGSLAPLPLPDELLPPPLPTDRSAPAIASLPFDQSTKETCVYGAIRHASDHLSHRRAAPSGRGRSLYHPTRS